MDPTKTTRTWRAGELALVVLAMLALVAAANAAQAFLIPLVAGILIAYALKPLVGALERMRVPRIVGAALVLVAMSTALAGSIVWVKGDAAAALAELPEAARQLRMAAHESANAPKNPIGNVREIVAELNRAAAEALGGAPAGTGKPPPLEPSVSSELQAWGTAQSSSARRPPGFPRCYCRRRSASGCPPGCKEANDMDPVAVFVALLFFGWLWGGWGLLLGGPMIAIVKTVAERIPAMRAFGEFLGR